MVCDVDYILWIGILFVMEMNVLFDFLLCLSVIMYVEMVFEMFICFFYIRIYNKVKFC